MIELVDTSLSYRQGAPVLKNVTLSMKPGSLHFVTGPSGAGKSSFLRLLYLAQTPTSGRLALFGKDASRLSRSDIAFLRRRIGVVFQDFQLLDHVSVFENVSLPLMVAGARERDYHANVMEMLDWVQLADKARQSPRRLSGGEKQRVAIARAMVSNPELIVADEPTGSIDPDMSERIMTLFAEMHRLGRTVVVATHDIGLVERFGGARLHIEQGAISERRAPSETATRYSAEFEARLLAARAARARAATGAEPTPHLDALAMSGDPTDLYAPEAEAVVEAAAQRNADAAKPRPTRSPRLFPQKAAAS